MKERPARAAPESVKSGTLFDSTRTQTVELQKWLVTKSAALKMVGKDSCATQEPSLSCLTKGFRVFVFRTYDDECLLCFLHTQFYAGTAIGDILLHL